MLCVVYILVCVDFGANHALLHLFSFLIPSLSPFYTQLRLIVSIQVSQYLYSVRK